MKEELSISEMRDEIAVHGMLDYDQAKDLITRLEQAEQAVARARESLSNHPRACEEHPENDAIKCGWKNAVIDVQNALDGEQK